MDDDPKRDDLERRRDDALRHYELAIAEANYASSGTPEYREAMQNIRDALLEIEEAEADQAS
jgi:hypothetical protein